MQQQIVSNDRLVKATTCSLVAFDAFTGILEEIRRRIA